MSRQKAGLRFDHDVAREIYNATDGSVMPLRAGWSGNQSIPSPDLLVPLDGSLRALELKTSSQDRLVVSQDDVEQILTWSMDMNEVPAYPYIVIKFTYYEPVTMRLPAPWDVEKSFEYIAENTALESRTTRSGNISFGHPSEYDSDVPSAASGENSGTAVLRDLYDDNPDGDREKVAVDTVLRQAPDYYG